MKKLYEDWEDRVNTANIFLKNELEKIVKKQKVWVNYEYSDFIKNTLEDLGLNINNLEERFELSFYDLDFLSLLSDIEKENFKVKTTIEVNDGIDIVYAVDKESLINFLKNDYAWELSNSEITIEEIEEIVNSLKIEEV